MKPVSVSVDVGQARADVFAFLDVMANHEPFTNHMLTDWEYSGADRGIGSKARVTSRLAGKSDAVEIEVVSADPPRTIVERNVSAKGRRVANGTYTLDELPSGGTRITFEYSWQQAPLADRLGGPLVRAILRRGNQRAMERLAELLASRTAAAG